MTANELATLPDWPLCHEHRCACGNRLSAADVDGECLECFADRTKKRGKLPTMFLCACGCGREVKSYRGKCYQCRRAYHLRVGKVKPTKQSTRAQTMQSSTIG